MLCHSTPCSRSLTDFCVSRSPDNTNLQVLANTTEMMSREGRLSASSVPNNTASSSRVTTENIRKATRPKTPLSPETLSTVESALFPAPRDFTEESELARYRADWRRWVAPLTLLQTLVRRCHVNTSLREENLPPDIKLLTPAEEKRLKDQCVNIPFSFLYQDLANQGSAFKLIIPLGFRLCDWDRPALSTISPLSLPPSCMRQPLVHSEQFPQSP
jgi:hypothetical protein